MPDGDELTRDVMLVFWKLQFSFLHADCAWVLVFILAVRDELMMLSRMLACRFSVSFFAKKQELHLLHFGTSISCFCNASLSQCSPAGDCVGAALPEVGVRGAEVSADLV